MSFVACLFLLLTGADQNAQPPADPHAHHAAVDARGATVMGFDQKTTTHHFVLTKDGGRIEVTAKTATDTAAIGQIRAHLNQLVPMFRAGNFASPQAIHATTPPGVEVMKRAGPAITYTYDVLPLGGQVHIATPDPAALAAVHAFLRFQIRDHRTGDPETVGKS